MKKLILTAVLFIISFSMLTASNGQTVYTTRDEEYLRVEELCRRAGVIGPSSFSPMPARALLIAMERIDTSSLSAEDRNEYEELYAILTDDKYTFRDDYFEVDFNAAANLGVNLAPYNDFRYDNSDSKLPDYDKREDTLIPYRYEDPLFALGLKMDFGEHIALEARLDLKSNHLRMYESTLGGVFTFLPDTKQGLAAEIPFRAGGSFGNDYFNFIIGRFPHSAGSGVTGNLIIGDNFNYQEVMLASLQSNHFTYNISITRFDQQDMAGAYQSKFTPDNPPNLTDPFGQGYYYYTDFSRHEFDGMQQFRINHRFDVTLFDKVRLALNLATIYNSHYGFDFRFFYPFVLGHNYYNYANQTYLDEYDEANNIMSIEVEWALTEGLTFSSQLAMDQLQTPIEDSTSLPSAFGLIANLKYSTNTDNGTVTGWFETVYTNPYLYLNGKYKDGTIAPQSFNLDYIVGYNMQYMDDFGYSGYIYGPDTIVFSLGCHYKDREDRFELGGDILYRVKGLKGLKHNTYSSNETHIDMSGAVIEDNPDVFMNNIWTPSGGWKNAEHMIKITVSGKYNFTPQPWGQVSLYSMLGAFTYVNYNHEGDDRFVPQFTFGAKWVF